jgi:hypothetical protein
MRKIVTEIKPTEVRLQNLVGSEIVAYRSKNSENFCILTKLTSKTIFEKALTAAQKYGGAPNSVYGFVALNSSTSEPRFIANTWQGAIELASKSREVFTFTSMKEMLESMVNNKF